MNALYINVVGMKTLKNDPVSAAPTECMVQWEKTSMSMKARKLQSEACGAMAALGGAFGNTDIGCAWVSSARATGGDKPEEGEDDVKSSYPLCVGRHTCYNEWDKGSRFRKGELNPKTHPQFGL
ncbi:hypothetical protein VNO78_13986 [Psophocarpus tetragonolobus]|uniref:Uncharacterized protein n=1 Tax=Psophocarpus tetragonolobus TaxID=3891 RepID=A0AAN9XQA4_PSOTE